MNSCQNERCPSDRCIFLVPHVLIPLPFAAANGVCAALLRSSGDAGKTEISAPVSAKYDAPVFESQTVKVFLLSTPLTEFTESGRYGRVGDAGEDVCEIRLVPPACPSGRLWSFPRHAAPREGSQSCILVYRCMPSGRIFCVRSIQSLDLRPCLGSGSGFGACLNPLFLYAGPPHSPLPPPTPSTLVPLLGVGWR